MSDVATLVDSLLAGDHRALARSISILEDRRPGHRELIAALHPHTGNARVIGVTGSPGTGKSTLVDRLAASYRETDDRIGIIGVDPASPFSGGAVLGDRIRMRSTVGDMDVFVRSMSARGALGGLSPATVDAVTALDAFGMERIIVETVGTGQNEVDIVSTADSVLVLVQPGSGDDVQMLKAGILEIGDIFVVNKADHPGTNRTVAHLREMLGDRDDSDWSPPIVETVATDGTGIEEIRTVVEEHLAKLETGSELDQRRENRYREHVRSLVRSDLADLADTAIDRLGGMDALVDDIIARETDPYAVADRIVESILNR